MTESRIKIFLTHFYENYLLECYKGFELAIEDEELAKKVENYNIEGYFMKHLDIYVESVDFNKEYNTLYNVALFSKSRESDPEPFNQLQLFLIDNFQLFINTILVSALKKMVTQEGYLVEIKLVFKAIDNKEVKLVDLIERSEKKMKERGVLPPSMG